MRGRALRLIMTAAPEHPWLKSYPAGIDWQARFEPQPIFALLDEAARRWPHRPAIDFLGRRWSWLKLKALVERAAIGFQKLGVTKGTKVGLFLPNCPQFLIAYYGVLKAGGTVVNFSPLYSEAELAAQIEDSHTDLMVTLDVKALYPKMAAMLGQTRLQRLIVGNLPEVLPFPKNWLYRLAKRAEVAAVPRDERHVRFADLIEGDERFFRAVEIEPEQDVAVLQYTGGTTGLPKGAMLTHANVWANAHQAGLWFHGLDEGAEKMLGVLPFFHVFAMTVVMNLSVLVGAEIVLHPRFELIAVLNDIRRKRPTLLPGVPTMFAAINHHQRIADYDLTSLKMCISGGAPLPLEVKQAFERLTGAKLVEGYGLTEASPVVTCNPLFGLNKPGSIGLPLPGTVVMVTDRDDPDRVLAQGEPGELCVEGPQVMAGYWMRPQATREAIRRGRLHTGDVGYIDGDGYVFLIDRIKDLILVGGFNVYPRYVEDAIYQHPAVEEVTVVGVPDDYRGQSPKAFVKLKPAHALTEAELLGFLRERLGKHELPREVEFRDTLPKTMIGKLSKKELAAEERAKRGGGKG